MASLKGTQTEKNLLTAFAGESQARNRYPYFASAAKKEAYVQISEIFTETANQEKEHAKRFFKFLEGGEVGSGRPQTPDVDLSTVRVGDPCGRWSVDVDLLDLGIAQILLEGSGSGELSDNA